MGMKGLTSVMVSASDMGAARRVVGGVGGAREIVEEEEDTVAAALALIAVGRSK